MSTLSELIPSGGTQNNIEFVAQGTLANGQTVALRSDGKVEAITQTSVTGSLGTGVEFEAAGTRDLAAAYSVEDNKYLVIYTDQGDSNKLKAVVGTPSGTNTLSFGTPVAVSSNPNQYQASKGCSYDATAKKIVVSFGDAGNSQYLTTFVATISGTSVSFGAATILNSATSNYVHSFYHAGAGKTCVVASLLSSGLLRTCTVGSTAITSSTAANFSSSQTEYTASCYESKNALGVIYFHRSSTDYPMVRGFTLSGETATFGTEDTLVSEKAGTSSIVYDVKNDYACIIMNYITGSSAVNTCQSIGVRFSSNGSVASKTSVTQVFAANANTGANAIAYDTAGESVYASFYNSSTQIVNQMAFSSNAYTVGTAITWSGSGSTNYPPALAFNSNNFTLGGFYRFGSSSGRGAAYIVPRLSTNATSFIGITNAAVSSGATGEVAVKGGLSTTADLGTFTPSFSTPVRYTTSNSAQPACSVCYDTTNDRYVMFYTDSTNSNYGYATVGTYSSGTTTWGTPVAVNSVNSSNVKAVFDASQGKVLFVYTNGSDSSKLVSVVGTVSGTSISVGSAVTMSASLTSTANTSVTYDANVNRSLVLTRVGSDSSKVYASVVSISGTTPTFNGTAVLTGTLATTQNIASCFDPDTNKVAAFVYDANASTTSGYVVTVSASSFSTSAGLNIGIAEALGMLSEYSTVANQVLVFVKPSAVTASQARTFTVAATLSVSSGWVNVTSSATASTLAIAEDVSKGVIVLAGQDEISGAQGKASLATISGASLTVTTATVFQASAANPATAVYNPDSSNVLIGYRNGSSYGTSAIVSVASDTLTIGSNYFVQDDGSLATTSSTNKAGKAISTTALNLVDPT